MNQMQEMTRAAEEAGHVLLEKGCMLVTAESCTGGLIGAVCTQVPGSSSWFFGGVISYANEAKMQGLSVAEETLLTFGILGLLEANQYPEISWSIFLHDLSQ